MALSGMSPDVVPPPVSGGGVEDGAALGTADCVGPTSVEGAGDVVPGLEALVWGVATALAPHAPTVSATRTTKAAALRRLAEAGGQEWTIEKRPHIDGRPLVGQTPMVIAAEDEPQVKRGRLRRKTAPAPGWLTTVRVPRLRRARLAAIARPRPVPCGSAACALTR